MKQESQLKSACRQELKKQLPGFVVISHADRTYGIPDWSVTGYGRTSWLEFKHATPKFDDTEIQKLTMLRLAAAGYARYIIYWENRSGMLKRTLIIHPRHIESLEPEASCVGHNHRFVVEFLRKVHQP